MYKTKGNDAPEATEEMGLGCLQRIIKLIPVQELVANQIDQATDCTDNDSRVNLNIARGSGDRCNTSNDTRGNGLNVVDTTGLLLRAPLAIDERLEEKDSDYAATDGGQLVDHGVEASAHELVSLV